MSKLLKITLPVLLIITCFIIVVNFLKIKDYKETLLANAEKVFNIKIVTNGELRLKFFGVVLEDVKILNNKYEEDFFYNIKNVEINFSPISLPFFNLRIQSIKLIDAVIPGTAFFGEISKIPHKVLLQDVRIRNDKLFVDFNIKNATYSRNGGNLKVVGKISGDGENLYNLAFLQSDNDKTKSVRLYNETTNIELNYDEKQNDEKQHDEKQHDEKQYKNYKLSGEGTDITQLLNDLTILKKSSTEASQFKLNVDLKNEENKLTINGDIYSDLINLSIRTQNVDGTDEKNLLDCKSTLINLDLISAHFLNSISKYFNYTIPSWINSRLKLSADDIKFHGKSIKDSIFIFDINNGELNYEKISAILPGNLEFISSGKIISNVISNVISHQKNNNENNNENSNQKSSSSNSHNSSVKVDGNFQLSGKITDEFLNWLNINNDEFKDEMLSMEARFILAPKMWIVSDLDFKLGDMVVNSSSINYKNISNIPKIRGEVNISGLNYDRKLIKNALTDQIVETKNNHEFDCYLALKLDNTKVNGKNIDNINIELSSSGRNNVSSIDVKSKNVNLNGKLLYNTANKDFNIKLDGESFDVDLIKFPELFKINTKEKDNNIKVTEITWNKDKISKFDSSLSVIFDFSVKKLMKNDRDIGSLLLNLRLANNILSLENFSIIKDYKSINAVSNIVLGERNHTIRSSFAIKNFEITDFFKKVLQIDYASGYVNLSGNIDSYGSNVNNLIENLSGTLNIGATDLLIDGVDFNLLPAELQSINSRSTLDNLTRIHFFKKNTLFKSINGSSNIRNGILGTSLKFFTEKTSGIISSNFNLSQMDTKSIVKIIFIAPKWGQQAADIDMQIEGSIWYPKVFFDNNQIYYMIQTKNEQFKPAT